MGQNEALDARSAEAFAEAYADLVEQLRPYAQRLVLVTPVPFEDPLGLGIDLEKRNRRLAENAEAIRKVAREKHLDLVDLHAAASREKTKNPRTRDGVHLSAAGHWWVAGQLADGLQKTKPLPLRCKSPPGPNVQLRRRCGAAEAENFEEKPALDAVLATDQLGFPLRQPPICRKQSRSSRLQGPLVSRCGRVDRLTDRSGRSRNSGGGQAK